MTTSDQGRAEAKREKKDKLGSHAPVALADVEAVADVDALRGAVRTAEIGGLIVVVAHTLAAEVKVLMDSTGKAVSVAR